MRRHDFCIQERATLGELRMSQDAGRKASVSRAGDDQGGSQGRQEMGCTPGVDKSG